MMWAETLANIIASDLKTGPVKWCRRCSRRHASRAACDLVRVERRAKSGRTVMRLVHRSRAEL